MDLLKELLPFALNAAKQGALPSYLFQIENMI
jgi:hypothetical protein